MQSLLGDLNLGDFWEEKTKSFLCDISVCVKYGSCSLTAINNALFFVVGSIGGVFPSLPFSLLHARIHLLCFPSTCQITWHSNAQHEPQSPFRSTPEWLKLTPTYEAHYPILFMTSHSREVRLWRHEREGKSNFMLMDSLGGKKKKGGGGDGDLTITRERMTRAWLTHRAPTTLCLQPPLKLMLPLKTAV